MCSEGFHQSSFFVQKLLKEGHGVINFVQVEKGRSPILFREVLIDGHDKSVRMGNSSPAPSRHQEGTGIAVGGKPAFEKMSVIHNKPRIHIER